jgi:hypothetical protein
MAEAWHIGSHWYRCQLCGESFSEHAGNVTDYFAVCEYCTQTPEGESVMASGRAQARSDIAALRRRSQEAE